MFDLDQLSKTLSAEWAVIHGTPMSFAVAMLIGWFIGWLVLRAWSARERRIAANRIGLLEQERDLERKQKEGLREVVKELKPDIPVLATEIGHGDPEIKSVVLALAAGKQFTTPVDPAKSPVHLFVARALSPTEIRNISNVTYTTANGLSEVLKIVGEVSISAGTGITTQIASYVDKKDNI
jgi:hypothetical protein